MQATRKNKTVFSNLPRDIQLLIAKKLPPENMLSVTKTSRSLRAMKPNLQQASRNRVRPMQAVMNTLIDVYADIWYALVMKLMARLRSKGIRNFDMAPREDHVARKRFGNFEFQVWLSALGAEEFDLFLSLDFAVDVVLPWKMRERRFHVFSVSHDMGVDDGDGGGVHVYDDEDLMQADHWHNLAFHDRDQDEDESDPAIAITKKVFYEAFSKALYHKFYRNTAPKMAPIPL